MPTEVLLSSIPFSKHFGRVGRATDHALRAAGYAAQSLLAALGCVQFVSNVFFASFVLKEQVRGSCSPHKGTATQLVPQPEPSK
jgi:hypothetical protein